MIKFKHYTIFRLISFSNYKFQLCPLPFEKFLQKVNSNKISQEIECEQLKGAKKKIICINKRKEQNQILS